MTAVRSLSSGVSGMLANQLSMDVVANNLANANTPGFKGSRVNFQTNLVQTLFSGSAPGNSLGGTNPRQVGLGTSAGSIEVNMNQGALNSTGRTLDVAIQGDGFFEVTDGTRSFYTRVGNFGLDANNDLVHLGTGYRVIGDTYNLDANPDGTQNVNDVGVPLNIPVEDAFPPSRTEQIEYQGNLDSAANALRGVSVQSLFSLRSTVTGDVASETTLLQDLSIFNEVQPLPAPGTTIQIVAYGTKPNGETYAGQFELHPWDSPTGIDNDGSVGELIESINEVFAQGGQRFASARLENGNVIISSVGDGDGLSMFLGEAENNVDFASPAAATATDPISNLGANTPIGGLSTVAGLTQNSVAPFTYDATTPPNEASYTATTERGLLDPVFYPIDDLDDAINISVVLNDLEVGTITIPAGTYSADDLQDRSFRLSSMPHIEPGDVVTYSMTGNPSGTPDIGITTFLVDDTDSTNLTTDSTGGSSNGIPDMFEENSLTDVNAWMYENDTNATFDWYRSRFVPDIVSSSIEVFDSQGGSHIVETRMFRIGTRSDSGTGARFNSWDAIVGIPVGEGELVDDVVAGLEFDQLGRFTGNVGTTAHATALNDTNYVGNPAVQSIQIDWSTTGPTDPANILMDFGDPLSFTGLTGFGSESTASAVDQDGFADGVLDSLSVSAEGDMIALYTNGISRSLTRLNLVTFRNPNGLESLAGNTWRQTTNSGNPIRRTPGQSAGFVTSGALEGGNVDIATEFAQMITAQRGFQVSARVIQTSDSMLEELANLLR